NDIIANLNERGAKIVISQHPRRTTPLQIDTEIYKWRHLIENFFCKLKEFKRIAMRADKTDQSFQAMIHLAAAVINSRCISTDPSQRLNRKLYHMSRPVVVPADRYRCRAIGRNRLAATAAPEYLDPTRAKPAW